MTEQTQLDILETLRHYWQELPLIKKVDKKDFSFLDNENRRKIVSILSIGYKDSDSEESFRRHALTVQEIQEQFKKIHDYEITEANTHFHIQKLIEKGFIREVLEIETGRRPKKYFGRTAKIFMSTAESDKFRIEEDEFTKKMIDLIQKINTDTKKEEIITLFEDMYSAKSKLIDTQKIEAWMDKYHQEIIDSEIEFKELFQYFSKAMLINKEFLEFYPKILKLLRYE